MAQHRKHTQAKKEKVEQVKADQAKKAHGRPAEFCMELAVHICELVAEGQKLVDICAPNDMPARHTVYRWIAEVPGFNDMYVRAREERGELFADEIVHISDTEPDPNKARVRIDARKWAAAKLNQRHYGDKVEVTGNLTSKMDDAQLESRLAVLLGKSAAARIAGGEGEANGATEAV